MGVGANAGLTPGTYLLGATALVLLVGIVGYGAVRLRRALLPAWWGPPARLFEASTTLAVVIGVALLLGTVGLLHAVPVALAYVVAGLALVLAGSRFEPSRAVEPTSIEPAPRSPVAELVAVALAGALVAAQWAMHIADAFGRGMTHPDTLWYHAPFAARFIADGRITELPDRADVIQAYYPANASVVHAVTDLVFDADVLSPLVNVGWAALALLAAWCVGRRWGLGALCVLATVLVLGLPMIAGTHPGQASNDVACAALLLVSVALLLEAEDFAPAPVTLAGIAAGLAIGTKLTVLVPVAVLTIGVIFLARRAGKLRAAAGWCAGLVAFGAFWYVRNLVEASNPLPWFSIDLGPFSLSSSAEEQGSSIFSKLTDGEMWDQFYVPGLFRALGRAWPAVLVLALGGAVLALRRSRPATERLVGLVVLAGTVAYVFTPGGGGLNFVFNVRYLAPSLLLGLVLLVLARPPAGSTARRLLVLALFVLVVVDATGKHYERVPGWPSDEVWWGVVAGAGVLVAVFAFTRVREPARRARLARTTAAVGFVVVLAVGWPVQRHFLDRRYAAAGLPFDSIAEYFRDVRDSDVAVFGTVEVYPMFGSDLSNRVRVAQGPSTPLRPDPCRQWPRILAGEYRYVVLTRYGIVFPVTPPEEWFSADPAATKVVDDGTNTVYRIDGPIHPAECVGSAGDRTRDQRRSSATAASTTKDVSAEARKRVEP